MMSNAGRRWPAVFAAAAFLLVGCVTDGTGPAGGRVDGGVAATFERAQVSIARNVVARYDLDLPAAYRQAEAAAGDGPRANYNRVRMQVLDRDLPGGARLPVILYLHGCAGLVPSSIGHLRELAKLDDFVVVAPDSFARERPPYCFRNFTVDLNVREAVIALREAEIAHAFERLLARPWVDRDNLFLVGHSQGGGLAAGYGGPAPIRARVLINGGCNPALGGRGFRAGEPVLSLDTGRDPWYQRPDNQCRALVRGHDGGRLIYDARSRSHDLALKHWPAIREFLTANRR